MNKSALPTRRNSLRYPGYDYRQPGWVFVTICTHHRQRLFGSVVDGVMVASPQGKAAEDHWLRLPDHLPGLQIDTLIVMPDHLHSVVFPGCDPEVLPDQGISISEIVSSFKIGMQAMYRANVANGSWQRYQSHLWQRGFYDRIIRTERELDAIRDYILGNPARWQEKHDAAPLEP